MNSRSARLFRSMGTLLFAFFAITGCTRQTKHPADDVLAEVNGVPITVAELQQWWVRQRFAQDTPEARQRALDQLVERKLLVQRALAAGLDQDPVVQEQHESILISRLKETQLQYRLAAIEISEAQSRAYYEANLATAFTQPEQSRLALLWFETRGQAPLAARYRPRLERARAEVIANAEAYPTEVGFGPLAVGNSEHRASRYKGGDLGWLEASNLPGLLPELEQAGRSLRNPGDVSDVIEVGNGIAVLRLIERRPTTVVPYQDVEVRIKDTLRREQQHGEELRFETATRAGAKITVHDDRLRELAGFQIEETQLATGDPARSPSALNR